MKFFIKFLIFYFMVINVQAIDNITTQAEIEKIIKKYLLENPEILIESLEKYRSNQEAKFEEKQRSHIEAYYKNKKYENFPHTGNISGSIIITEFIDYNCSYCKKTLIIINKLLKKYKNIKVVFIDFPILSETSYSAAKAAIAAHRQNAYFSYHTALLDSKKKISNEYLIDLADSLNLDLKKFKKDMNSEKTAKIIEDNIEFAKGLNVRGTPTFIINKKLYPGAYDMKKLEEIIKKI